MKQKFEQQIEEIASLPEHITQMYGLDTVWLTQQNKTIKSLTDRLLWEVENLTTSISRFDQIMDGEQYDTEICYERPDDDEEYSYWEEKLAHPNPKLKVFFESNKTSAEKEEIERVIIFAVFLQVTRDFYHNLRLEEIVPPHATDHHEPFSKNQMQKIIRKTKDSYCNYLDILDNIAYKCHPTAYTLFSALIKIGICLAFAAIFTIPFAVPLIMFGSPVLAGLFVSGLLIFSLVLPLIINLCPLIPAGKYGFLTFINKMTDRWRTNWAYPLPFGALEFSPYPARDAPTDIGIFPNFCYLSPKYTAPVVGSSFHLMNKFGFFPFEETARKATEMAEIVAQNSLGTTAVKLC